MLPFKTGFLVDRHLFDIRRYSANSIWHVHKPDDER